MKTVNSALKIQKLTVKTGVQAGKELSHKCGFTV